MAPRKPKPPPNSATSVHSRFAKYATGSRGTSEAKAYVAERKAKNKGPR